MSTELTSYKCISDDDRDILMDNGNADRSGDSDTGPLDGTPLDRRSFLGLAATTGAALTLPESATASSHVTDPRVN
ncbi:MAG: hypothetical protein ACI9K3_001361, partial [Halovenus sp.]